MTKADALLEEFADWLDERGKADPTGVADEAETFLNWWDDAPLESIDDQAIGTFLLEWCPRHLTMAPERSPDLCDAVGEFVYFLGCTGRLRGGQERGRSLLRTAVGLADAMQAKMADPSNYGMAKSLFAGIDGAGSMTEQELMAAMQQRINEHNALPFEERKALTDAFFAPTPQTVELPFLYVPPSEQDVAAAVTTARMPAQMRTLCDYLGEKGKVLTAKGNLKLVDGRTLVDLLDTGDELDPTFRETTYKTRSTESLRRLMYLLAVAEESGVVRHRDGRLVPVKAWLRNSPIDQATKLVRTVIDFGVLSMMGARAQFYADLHGLIDEGVVHWLAALLPPDASAGFEFIADLNEEVVFERFDGENARYYVSFGSLTADLSRILTVLESLGVIEWSDRQESTDRWGQSVESGGTIALTAFGRHVLPEFLSGAGLTLRTATDLAEAELPDLIEAMDSIPAEQHSTVLDAWKPSLSTTERAAQVAALIAGAEDARTRLFGLHLIGMFDTKVSEPHVRQLLDTPAAGHAAIWLLDRGLADGDTVGGFITPAVMVDLLSQMLEEPEVLCEQFLAGHDPVQMLESFWRYRAPETAEVLDALGQHLPDRVLAKQARKAAIKHRSWMANNGPR